MSFSKLRFLLSKVKNPYLRVEEKGFTAVRPVFFTYLFISNQNIFLLILF